MTEIITGHGIPSNHHDPFGVSNNPYDTSDPEGLGLLSRLFGPVGNIPVNPSDRVNKQMQTIVSFFQGNVKLIGANILRRVPDYGTWHFRVSSLSETDDISDRSKRTLIFQSFITAPRGPLGTVSRITNTEESSEYSFHGTGLGVTFEMEYLSGPEGDLYLSEQLNQLAEAACNQLKLDIIRAILWHPIMEKARDVLALPSAPVEISTTANEINMYGILSKKKDGIVLYTQYLKKLMKTGGLNEARYLILPDGAKALINLGSTAAFEVFRNGEAAVNDIKTNGENATIRSNGLQIFEETDYRFENQDLSSKNVRPLDGVGMHGWGGISSPCPEECSLERYSELRARTIGQYDIAGRGQIVPFKFEDMVQCDILYDNDTGDIKNDLIDAFEGHEYKQRFAELKFELTHSARGDPLVGYNFTVTDGVAKHVDYFGAIDTHYFPHTMLKTFAINIANCLETKSQRSIDMAAVEDLINIMEASAQYPMFINGQKTFGYYFVQATASDPRNATTPGNLFSGANKFGVNYPPNISADLFLGVFDPIEGITNIVDDLGGNVPVPQVLDAFPYMGTIGHMKTIAGNPSYDPTGRIQKGVANFIRLRKALDSAFSCAERSNLFLNPALVPAYLKVQPQSAWADEQNKDTALMGAMGLIYRPIAWADEGARERIDWRAAFAAIGVNSIGSRFEPGNASSGLRDDIVQGGKATIRHFDKVISSEVRTKLRKTSGASTTSHPLDWWIQSMINKKFDATRITIALDRLFTFLATQENYEIDEETLNGLEKELTEDEAARTSRGNTKEGRKDNFNRSKLRQFDVDFAGDPVEVAETAENYVILRLVAAPSVFGSQIGTELENSNVRPVLSFDDTLAIRGSRINVINTLSRGKIQTSDRRELYQVPENTDMLADTIFGHPDLALKSIRKGSAKASASSKRALPKQKGGHRKKVKVASIQEDQRVQDNLNEDGNLVPAREDFDVYPENLITFGLENRFFAERVNFIRSQNLTRIQKLIAYLYLGLPLNKNAYFNLANADFSVPLTYLVNRPFIKVTVAAGLMLNDNVVTTEVAYPSLNTIEDGEIKAVNVNMTMHAGSGVTSPQSVLVHFASMFRGYHGGASNQPIKDIDNGLRRYNTDAQNGVADFYASDPNGERTGDVIYFSVAPTWNLDNLPHAYDISGPLDPRHFNAASYKAFTINKKHTIESLAMVAVLTGLNQNKEEIVGVTSSQVLINENLADNVNTMIVPGRQMNWCPKSGKLSNLVRRGEGCLGDPHEGCAYGFLGIAQLTEPMGAEITVV